MLSQLDCFKRRKMGKKGGRGNFQRFIEKLQTKIYQNISHRSFRFPQKKNLISNSGNETKTFSFVFVFAFRLLTL